MYFYFFLSIQLFSNMLSHCPQARWWRQKPQKAAARYLMSEKQKVHAPQFLK